MTWSATRLRQLRWLIAILAGVGLGLSPDVAPWFVLVSLFTAAPILGRAWAGTCGTELRPAVIWGGMAGALGIGSQLVAAGSSLETGRVFAGCLSYLAVLSTLAASITVLNARRPGGGAWAILMGLLVLVFLIPWLEGAGLRRGWGGLERLRLDSPWNIFFGLVVIAGVTNYLPTRYGPAAVWIGFGCGLEYLALSGWIVDPSQRARIWSVAPWCLGMAAVVADSIGAKPPASTSVESLWLWFRDRWGVVWALRVQDRFNRTAELQGWPFRLGWEGLTRESPQTDVDEKALDGALDTLCGLLRRFASVGCLERAARPGDEGRGCG